MDKKFEAEIKTLIKNEAVLLDLIEEDSTITILIEVRSDKKNQIKLWETEINKLSQKKVIIHQTLTNKEPRKEKKSLAGVDKIILVASGKGGVGKSSISALLALFLSKAGFRVGLCDLDLHGPSLPKICGLSGPLVIKDDLFQPQEVKGIKIISMALLMEGDSALIWRGPMLTKALHQFLLKSNWGQLDYLILDSPPGTGDLQLSLAENYNLTGTILVSTPQEVALLATHRSLDMMRKLLVPIVGLVGNQVYLETEGIKNYLFGEGNLEAYCDREQIKLLGLFPLVPALSESFDKGSLIDWLDKAPEAVTIFQKILEEIVNFSTQNS